MRAALSALLVLAAAPAAATPAGEEMTITAASAEARAAFSRGRAAFYNLRTAEARRALEEAVRLDPGCALAHLYLALATKPVAAGRAHVDRALKLRPDVTVEEAMLADAVDAQLRGDVAEEMRLRKLLVASLPGDWRPLVGVGNRLVHLGRHAEAVEWLERAVKTAPDEAAPYNDLGYAYAGQEKWDEAVRTLRLYAKLLPNEPNPHDSLAETLMRAGKLQEAVAEYREALRVDPAFVVGNEGLGHALLLSGDVEQARAAYARWADTAETGYERMAALDWLAASYAHEGRVDETIRQLERAEARAAGEKEPVWTQIFPLHRAIALSVIGRAKEAAPLADQVGKRLAQASLPPALRDELLARALFARGYASAESGEVAAARAALKDLSRQLEAKKLETPEIKGLPWILRAKLVLAQPPGAGADGALETAGLENDPWGLATVADAMERTGRAEEANRLRSRALRLNIVTPELGFVRPRLLGGGSLVPGSRTGPMPVTTSSSAALALFDEARRLGEAYKRPVAFAVLDRAVALDKDFALARCYKAVFAEITEENADELDRAAKIAASGRTSYAERLFIEAHVAERAGDPAGKEKRLRELAQMYPNDWRPAAYLGEHLLRLGRRADAIRELQDAVKRAPGESYPYNALGYALAREGRTEDAIAALRKYVERSPGESNPHDSLAEVLMLAGRFKEAEAEYRRSLDLSPQFAASWAGVGHARLFAGDATGAREAYRTMYEVAGLSAERLDARTWRATTFAVEGRFAEAAGALAVAEIEADAAKDRFASAMLSARRIPITVEAGRAKDAVALAGQTLRRTGKLSPAGRDRVERAVLFGRGWAELALEQYDAVKATAKDLAARAARGGHPESAQLANVLLGAAALQQGIAPEAHVRLQEGDPHDPLHRALLADALEASGQAEKAREARKSAVTPTANHVDLPVAMAWVKKHPARSGTAGK